MTHDEFRQNLLASIAETIADSQRKREMTSNPLTYAIHTAQLELLSNLNRWVESVRVDACCQTPEVPETAEGPVE